MRLKFTFLNREHPSSFVDFRCVEEYVRFDELCRDDDAGSATKLCRCTTFSCDNRSFKV